MQRNAIFSSNAACSRNRYAGVRGIVLLCGAALVLAPSAARGACNLIPQTEKTFDSVRGATTRPFAAAGEPLEVRLRPCDVGAPTISTNATNHLVTVIYTPTGSGAKNAIVLTAAADCSAVTPLLSACKTQPGAGSDAQCVSLSGSGMQAVTRNMTN